MRRTLLSTLLFVAFAPAAFAQVRVGTTPRAAVAAYSAADPDRAMLGVSTSSDGKRDTLGLLVSSVTEGSPAEKAGIEEGNRIGSVNGISLKLSRADAGESDMGGVMTNRLVREMRKLKPGDEATLEVWANGRYKTVKVKTVSAEDLMPTRPARVNDDERAALGVSVSSTGNRRDTLGVFVSSVTEDGPAEKAGITEGDRIASINGVDLRASKEDVGEGWVSSGKVGRLQREIGKLKPGQSTDLVVVSGGRSRTVKVTAARARDLKDSGGFSFRVGDGMGMMNLDGVLRESLRNIGPQIRMEMNHELPRAMEKMQLELDRELPRAMNEMHRKIDLIGLESSRAATRLRIAAPQLRAKLMRGVTI